jgi:hypothetical protein
MPAICNMIKGLLAQEFLLAPHLCSARRSLPRAARRLPFYSSTGAEPRPMSAAQQAPGTKPHTAPTRGTMFEDVKGEAPCCFIVVLM